MTSSIERARNLQAFVERVIWTLKHEVLNAFCLVSERHLLTFARANCLNAGEPGVWPADGGCGTMDASEFYTR